MVFETNSLTALILCRVYGLPGTKGSSRAIIRGGKAVSVPGGSNAGKEKREAWENLVRWELRKVIGPREDPVFIDVPVVVEMDFFLPRPANDWAAKGGLKPKAQAWPWKTPDLDKITRATADALTGYAVNDDARIVEMRLSKRYARPGQEGAFIAVWRAIDEEGLHYSPIQMAAWTNERERRLQDLKREED